MIKINGKHSPPEQFQALNEEIYTVENRRHHSIEGLLQKLAVHTGRILKAIRKEDYKNIEYNLAMVWSWCMAIANVFDINVGEKMWEFFPGHCPYCLSAPCNCNKERPQERQKQTEIAKRECPFTLAEYQVMFGIIYPNNPVNSGFHLAEEVIEVQEAVGVYSSTHSKEWFKKVEEELIDVLTNIFSVCNSLNYDLASIVAAYFENGCPACQKQSANVAMS